jgi:hypothetical protein
MFIPGSFSKLQWGRAKAFRPIVLWSFGIACRDLQSGSKAPEVSHADGLWVGLVGVIHHFL